MWSLWQKVRYRRTDSKLCNHSRAREPEQLYKWVKWIWECETVQSVVLPLVNPFIHGTLALANVWAILQCTFSCNCLGNEIRFESVTLRKLWIYNNVANYAGEINLVSWDPVDIVEETLQNPWYHMNGNVWTLEEGQFHRFHRLHAKM